MFAPKYPRKTPPGYEALDESETFDPAIHLQLEYPEKVWTLHDLGYSQQEVAESCTEFAVASPARLLSQRGAEVLLNTARSLRQFTSSCDRVENMVRGGVYRSAFLRELCTNKEVTEFMSDLYRVKVAPHSMPSQLGHLNFAPSDLSKAVDKWHYDTLELDYVMMVSDPNQIKGGEFQYFMGTKKEAQDFADKGEAIPRERIVSPRFDDAGYFVAFQGFMVVHRGAKLLEAAERISMVNGYVPLVKTSSDRNRFDDLLRVDPEQVLLTEWARHKAWLSQNRLAELSDELRFSEDRSELIDALKAGIADVQAAIDDLAKDRPETMEHFGG